MENTNIDPDRHVVAAIDWATGESQVASTERGDTAISEYASNGHEGQFAVPCGADYEALEGQLADPQSEIGVLVAKVRAGYQAYQKDFRRMARFTPAAEAAMEEIESLISRWPASAEAEEWAG